MVSHISIFLTLALVLSCSPTRKGAEPEKPGPPTTTIQGPVSGELVKAVLHNDVARVIRLLQMGSDVNEDLGNESGPITPLLVAVALGNEAMANTLLMRGASTLVLFEGYDVLDFADHLSLATTLELIKNVR